MSTIPSASQTPLSSALDFAAMPTMRNIHSPNQAQSVGREFEGLFMSMMVKQMRSSLEEGFFNGDQSDVYGGLFDLMLGQSLAASSPLGLQSMIAELITRQQASRPVSTDTSMSNGNDPQLNATD